MLLPESYLHNSNQFDARKARGFLAALTISYLLYGVFLYWLWYGGTARTPFHLFDDWHEWLQMDKAGHFLVTFHTAMMAVYVFAWAGYNYKQAAMYGFFVGCFVLLPVEVMDGFSAAWGFSWADIAANVLGPLFAYSQLRGLRKIIFLPKFSYHTTLYTLARPDMFGAGYLQNSLKDYNGQTYWLNIDINAITGIKILPAWLHLCIGYGGEAMYGGHDNVWTDKQGQIHDLSNVARYRQWYLSFDFDFTTVVKNTVLQRILYPVNIFKVPFPALEFSERGIVPHWIYY